MVDLDSMTEAVATYAARAAEKMRRHGVRTVHLSVFMHTSRFSEGPGNSNGATAGFLEATNDTGEMVALAVRVVRRIWRAWFRCAKARVMITELLPATARQPALWNEIDRQNGRSSERWSMG